MSAPEAPVKTTMSIKEVLRDTNLLIVFSITLMAVMAVSSITPAFPSIIKHFSISPAQVGLLITVFTLPGVFLPPFTGVLADRLGRKRILVPSLLLFGVAGTACGFAQTFEQLVVLRFLQGLGGASLGTLNTTLLGDLYKGRMRTAVMGYNSSVLSIGTASYPAIGGLLATFGWHYPFFLPVIAVGVGLFTLFCLNNPEPHSEEHLRDYLRNAVASIRHPKAVLLFIASLVTFVILYGPYLTFLPILLDERFGSSALAIGLLFSVGSIVSAVTATQLGRLSRRYSEKSLIRSGFVLYVAVLSSIPFIPDFWWLLIPAAGFGIAQALNIPSIFSLLTGMAPLEYRAAFMSFNGMVLRLGQTLGPALAGLAFGWWGLNGSFLFGATVAVVMLLVLMVPIRLEAGH